jgi:hypothetical protein
MAALVASKVSKREFDDFIAKYPHELVKDIYRAGDPAVLSYNDFVKAKQWPESVVAYVMLGSDWPGGEDEYYIK